MREVGEGSRLAIGRSPRLNRPATLANASTTKFSVMHEISTLASSPVHLSGCGYYNFEKTGPSRAAYSIEKICESPLNDDLSNSIQDHSFTREDICDVGVAG